MLKNLVEAFNDFCVTAYLYYSLYTERLFEAAEKAKSRS